MTAVLATSGDVAIEMTTSPFLHLLLRRTTAGDAELHETDLDLVHVRAGRALLTTGGVLDGARREVSKGEFRAASITGGATRAVAPGDVLVVPAGVPHLWTPVGDDPFVYVIIKVPVH